MHLPEPINLKKLFYNWQYTWLLLLMLYWSVNRLEAWKKLDNLARQNPDVHKLTSLMKECSFMEIETVDSVNAASIENNDDDKIIMNNINNLMVVDDNEDR